MHEIVIGIDEVGRGALAGPFVVCAAGFSKSSETEIRSGLETVLCRTVTDSKKLTASQRERGAEYLKAQIIFAIGAAEASEIDQLGLAAAARLATGRALDGLPQKPTSVMADAGLRHPYEDTIPTEWFVKGDETILQISCASIIAKVYRDTLMHELARTYPNYQWERNVGYGTAQHRASILKYNATPQHRLSFISNAQSWQQ